MAPSKLTVKRRWFINEKNYPSSEILDRKEYVQSEQYSPTSKYNLEDDQQESIELREDSVAKKKRKNKKRGWYSYKSKTTIKESTAEPDNGVLKDDNL